MLLCPGGELEQVLPGRAVGQPEPEMRELQ